jgi:two-component system OmpR family sensor kinase
LVNDLLVLTRADAGALNLQFERVDLAELARARCDALATLAASHWVALQVRALGEPVARGDADRLSQVLDNLLDNAIRHAKPGSSVIITILQEGDEIMCAVSDQGCGIPEEHLPHVFKRFYRVEGSRARYSGGSGLGLAIVHSLVSAHGGRVAIDSIEGQGTTIAFWLEPDANCHELV